MPNNNTVFSPYRLGTVQTRRGERKDQEEGGELTEEGELAERYRTGAMWLESASSSSLHQLQYTRSDDAWKSIYATSREGRQRRERGREIQRMDGKIDISLYWFCTVKTNGTTEVLTQLVSTNHFWFLNYKVGKAFRAFHCLDDG